MKIIRQSLLAKTGIQNGMTLLKINGEVLKSKSLRDLNALLLRLVGAMLNLLIKQDKEAPYELTNEY
jgi:hypothetical protein